MKMYNLQDVTCGEVVIKIIDRGIRELGRITILFFQFAVDCSLRIALRIYLSFQTFILAYFRTTTFFLAQIWDK